MADLAKDLVGAVRRAFTRNCKSDTVISGIERTLKKNGVSYREAEEYAARLGELLAQAYQKTITPDMLPDGKLDEAMAEELLRSLLTQNYQQAAEVAARVQTSLNRAAGIGMKGLIPEQREDRLTGLIQKAASYDSYEKASWVLDEPVVNYTQSAVEDTIEKNAGAHYRSGLHPKIKRISVGGCCKWCNSLAGTHDYPVPREIYRRHERCRCLVLYDPGDGKIQDAHTKKVYEGSLKKAAESAAQERKKEAARITKPGPKERHKSIKNSDLENGLPMLSLPESTTDKTDENGKVLQRRIYGADGIAEKDFDTTDHNNPERHPTGAHKHIFERGEKVRRGKPMALTDKELEENSDIIQRGVNYHDEG